VISQEALLLNFQHTHATVVLTMGRPVEKAISQKTCRLFIHPIAFGGKAGRLDYLFLPEQAIALAVAFYRQWFYSSCKTYV